MTIGFPGVDRAAPPARLADAINRINQGKINVILRVTLTPSASQTTITDARISPQTAFLFDPLTQNAATLAASGSLHVHDNNRFTGSAIIDHNSSALTDRTFNIVMLG